MGSGGGSGWVPVAGRAAAVRVLVGVFRRWQRDGTWQQVLTGLQALADAAGRITWDVSVDSTSARAHQHAAGARKRGICRPDHPAASPSNRPTTRSAAPAAG
jgi:transposase